SSDLPLRRNSVGASLAPDQAPTKPNAVEPPEAIRALYPRSAAVTRPPAALTSAFHACVTCCSEGNRQARSQPSRGSPRLVTVTSDRKRVGEGHWPGAGRWLSR